MELRAVRRGRAAAVASAFFALLLAFAAFAPRAWAGPAEYLVWVQGIQITEDNAYDVLGDGTVSFTWDNEINSGVLMLDGAHLVVNDKVLSEEGDAAAICTDTNLIIVLRGENTIDAPATALKADYVDAICAFGDSVEITGTGSLAATLSDAAAPGENALYGIYAKGLATFTDGADVTFAIGDGSNPEVVKEGVSAKDIRVEDDAHLTVATAPSSTHADGIGCDSLEIAGNAKVSVDVADAPGDSASSDLGSQYQFGISTSYFVADEDAQVVVNVGAARFSSGIEARYSAYIGGNSVVMAYAGKGVEGSYGIAVSETEGQFTILEDAIVEALGDSLAFSKAPDLSDHNNPQAYVNEDYERDPAKADEWDTYSVLGGSVSLYKFVRIGTLPVIFRIAGDYANETAAKISETTFTESEWVVIARDDDFADALGATGLAGTLHCPIVLTNRMELSKAAAEEVSRLGAKHAYIIGGTGAIKTQVDADLAKLGVAVEPRIWGDNSYDTSLACAKKIVELGGDDMNAVIAMSTNFQDALSFSPIAYQYGLPVILQTWGATSADRGFTPEAQEWLAGKQLTVVGGPGAISDASISKYSIFARIYGETGYDTSNEIAKWGLISGYFDTDAVIFACGAQAPKGTDALAGAAIGGEMRAPILLVNSNTAMESANLTTVDGYFADHALGLKSVVVLGGTYVAPADLFTQIAETAHARVINL